MRGRLASWEGRDRSPTAGRGEEDLLGCEDEEEQPMAVTRIHASKASTSPMVSPRLPVNPWYAEPSYQPPQQQAAKADWFSSAVAVAALAGVLGGAASTQLFLMMSSWAA